MGNAFCSFIFYGMIADDSRCQEVNSRNGHCILCRVYSGSSLNVPLDTKWWDALFCASLARCAYILFVVSMMAFLPWGGGGHG